MCEYHLGTKLIRLTECTIVWLTTYHSHCVTKCDLNIKE